MEICRYAIINWGTYCRRKDKDIMKSVPEELYLDGRVFMERFAGQKHLHWDLVEKGSSHSRQRESP